MADIEKGFDDKLTRIVVFARDDIAMAEMWIKQTGEQRYSTNQRTGEIKPIDGGTETLSYITIQEAIALRDELNVAIKEMAGV